MKKHYLLTQVNATGNGFISERHLVTDLRVENGAIIATKVAEPSTTSEGYEIITPTEIVVIGNAICEEVPVPFN